MPFGNSVQLYVSLVADSYKAEHSASCSQSVNAKVLQGNKAGTLSSSISANGSTLATYYCHVGTVEGCDEDMCEKQAMHSNKQPLNSLTVQLCQSIMPSTLNMACPNSAEGKDARWEQNLLAVLSM